MGKNFWKLPTKLKLKITTDLASYIFYSLDQTTWKPLREKTVKFHIDWMRDAPQGEYVN